MKEIEPLEKDAQFTIAESGKAMDGMVRWDQRMGSRIDVAMPGAYAMIARKNTGHFLGTRLNRCIMEGTPSHFCLREKSK